MIRRKLMDLLARHGESEVFRTAGRPQPATKC